MRSLFRLGPLGWISVAFSVFACSDGSSISTLDSGPTPDARTSRDAKAITEAGETTDAKRTTDGRVVTDGSRGPDGRVVTDGSSGPDASGDAGMRQDGGGYYGCPLDSLPGQGSACISATCAPGATGTSCAFGVYNTNFLYGLCCDGVCVDPSQDPNHCGGCGTVCQDAICASSAVVDGNTTAKCLPLGGASAVVSDFSCPPPQKSAGGQCLTSSCGAGLADFCETAAGGPGFCCMPGSPGSECVDLTSDPNNCGDCYVACPAGQTCSGGLCSGSVAPCGLGQVGKACDLAVGLSAVCCPGGGCTDTDTDVANCGACGFACESPVPGDVRACRQGACVEQSCAAVGNVDKQDAVCALGEGSGICCGTSCLDPDEDPLNCGRCGTACGTGETCSQGSCGFPTCGTTNEGSACHLPAGSAGVCCGSACIDTANDPHDCGSCNTSCTSGTCSGGQCQ